MHPLVIHCKRSDYDIYIGRGRFMPRVGSLRGDIQLLLLGI
jgi:hypothetical protein